MKNFTKFLFACMICVAPALVKGQDLIVNSSSLTFTYDFQSASLTNIGFDIENIGTFSTFGSVKTEVFLVDIGTGSWKIGEVFSDAFGISGGSSESLTIANVDLDNVGLATGTYYIKVVTDTDDDESETDETNNEYTATGSSNEIYFESLTTGINGLGVFETVSMYPNPAIDQVTLSYTLINEETATINVFDLAGKNVFTQNLGTQAPGEYRNNISLGDFEAGVYIVRLSTNNSIVTKRITVQR